MITDAVKKTVLDRTGERPGKIDLIKAMELRAKGASYQDIANVFHATKQSVQGKIERFTAKLGNLDEIQEFSEIEKTVQDALRLKYALHLADDDVIKQSSAAQAATVYGIVYDKRFAKNSTPDINISVTIQGLIATVHPPTRHDPEQPIIVVNAPQSDDSR